MLQLDSNVSKMLFSPILPKIQREPTAFMMMKRGYKMKPKSYPRKYSSEEEEIGAISFFIVHP